MIDFGSLGGGSTATVAAGTTEVAPATGSGVVLNLEKGGILNLTKNNPSLTKVRFCAGWDIAQGDDSYDLDIAAYLCHADGKIKSGNDVVYFNHESVPGVTYNGDNRTGAGDGDDETMDLDLSAIASDISRIVFCIVIHDAANKQQTFGMVQNSYARLLNTANGDVEICRIPLKENYGTNTAVIVAELIRNGSDWEFKAISEGKRADLNQIAAMYL